MLDDTGRILAGIMLLSMVTIEFGGYFMTKIVRGQVPMTGFQKSFARAGHAHAGVLVILGLVTQLLMPSSGLTGIPAWIARLGVPAAAILMSGGFFAASAGKDRTQPNKAIVILFLGAASLAAGVIALGLGLLTA
ncbi:hypothetical protein Afil01_42770 [Actinorhabdospora filicis]|uniref:Uncharacterized protein n=1 Tax=Actinorhabdospora filicis TaxID=1785913 RepID=A0A9W6SP68_9ACTN|nr:hypothetical protein [Actinorhabdospora filicis]GLZ79470.1 hypothetical protein Afil01_42770 [Actinorhabdospora filicis]